MKLPPLRHVMEVIGLTAFILFIIFIVNNPLSTQSPAQSAATAAPISGITSTGALSSACDALYNLPSGTVTSSAGSPYLNPQVCAAYQYLIARYNPGPASQVGLTNAKVTGITSLNPKFAVALAGLLQAADAKGYHITINSAYRTQAGENQANKKASSTFVSMHTLGLAADLNFPEVAGNSAAFCGLSKGTVSGVASYNFIIQNEASFGLGSYNVRHKPVSGECNHVEWAGAVPGGLGPGSGANLSPAQAAGPNTSTPAAGANATAPSTGTDVGGSIPDTENDTAWSQGQTCPTGQECYNCTGNTCLTVPNNTTSNASNSVNNNGQCTLGSINVGGGCLPMSMLQSLLSPQQASTPPPPAPTPTPTPAATTPAATTQSSSATTPASSIASTLSSIPSVASTPVTQTPITSNLLQLPTTSVTATTTVATSSLSSLAANQAILNELENPPPIIIPSAPTTTIALNQTTQAVTQLTPSAPPSSLQPASEPLSPTVAVAPVAAPVPTQNNASLGPIVVGQRVPTETGGAAPTTFTSGGFTGSSPQQGGAIATFGQRTASAALAILQTLQGELINALQYLKPFGGNTPNNT